MLRLAIDTHLITSHFALPLLIRRPGGLLVEMTDGTREYNETTYRNPAFYDLAKTAVLRLAFAQAKELEPHGCTAVALTPGWMRSEMMLEHYGVTEATWREATVGSPHFTAISETPRFVGRAVAALAADPEVQRRNGGSFSSGGLAREYGFTDVDGSQPDCWRYLVEVQDAGAPARPDRLPLSRVAQDQLRGLQRGLDLKHACTCSVSDEFQSVARSIPDMPDDRPPRPRSQMSTPSPLAIEATGLVKSFGETRAVDGVDLAVRRGSVYGVLGPNGAGKTTTIRMLATLIRPDAGSARVLGHDIVTEADAVRSAVSLTGQLASVDEDLTGRENLILLARLLGLKRQAAKARATELLEAFGLAEAAGEARQELLRRDAAPARHRREHRRHPRADVPRRAHDRARPALAQPGLGHHPRAGVGGDHDPAVHPVPRGGRPARRGDRRDRPRQGHRRGHARPAQGLRRLGHAARAPAGPRAATRGRAGAAPRARRDHAGARPGRAVGLLLRRRPRRAGRRRAVPLGRADRRLLARPAEPRRGLPRPDGPSRRGGRTTSRPRHRPRSERA